MPEATVAAWFPESANMLKVKRILTTVPNKPRNGATPPIVPKIVKWLSNFLVAKAAEISNDLEKPPLCSEKILTASSITSPITPPHLIAVFCAADRSFLDKSLFNSLIYTAMSRWFF